MTKLTELLKSRKAIQALLGLGLGVWGWFEGAVEVTELLALYAVVGGFWANAQAKVDAAKVAAPTE